MKKKLTNFLLLSLVSGFSFAQTNGYRFYSVLDTIKNDGFYNIVVTPDLNAHVKTDYSDIRIVNDAGKWIPHVLHAPYYDETGTAARKVLKFSMLENSTNNTQLLIEKDENIISNFSLLISSTAAERFCTLSGSNDKSNWFVINDSVLLHPEAEENATENIIAINFPASSYSFYKIIIYNKNKDPFNIKAVVQNTAIVSPQSKITYNPAPQIQQKDSGRMSYIKVRQQQPYQFDAISLEISNVKYYKRQIELYIPLDEANSFSNPGRLIYSATITNNSTSQFKIPLTKATEFYLLIKNGDNLPLKVNTVNTSCSYHYITAYLEKGNNYRLIAENKEANLPEYDLSKINPKIADNIPYLGLGKIIAFDEKKPVVAAAHNNKWLLWTAIAIALIILLFFTAKMLKEVDKRKTT